MNNNNEYELNKMLLFKFRYSVRFHYTPQCSYAEAMEKEEDPPKQERNNAYE